MWGWWGRGLPAAGTENTRLCSLARGLRPPSSGCLHAAGEGPRAGRRWGTGQIRPGCSCPCLPHGGPSSSSSGSKPLRCQLAIVPKKGQAILQALKKVIDLVNSGLPHALWNSFTLHLWSWITKSFSAKFECWNELLTILLFLWEQGNQGAKWHLKNMLWHVGREEVSSSKKCQLAVFSQKRDRVYACFSGFVLFFLLLKGQILDYEFHFSEEWRSWKERSIFF